MTGQVIRSPSKLLVKGTFQVIAVLCLNPWGLEDCRACELLENGLRTGMLE